MYFAKFAQIDEIFEMAKKIQHIYHLFVFCERPYLDDFQIRTDCYFKNVDSVVRHLSSILCRVKGKRELIKNMEEQVVMTEEISGGRIVYVVRKVQKNDIMFNLLYLFDKQAALMHWSLDSLTDEFFKRIGESKDDKKKQPAKLPKIF